MSKDRVVVGPDLTPDWLEKRRKIMFEIENQLIRGLREKGKGLTLDQLQMVLEHKNPFWFKPSLFPADPLAEEARKNLSKFFGKGVEILPPPPEFTPENLSRWERFNLYPVYLPNQDITQHRKLKTWIKPDNWFYSMIQEGKIASDSFCLKPGWYLADFTKGTDYTDGSQVFVNDPLSPIIEKLRSENKVGKHDNTPPGSRFSITHEEWVDTALPTIAQELGFESNQVKLERAIEFNALGNVYDPDLGKFNMWEWFHDAFGVSYRLRGGGRGGGGLARVYYHGPAHRHGSIAGRPLVSFTK